MARGAALLSCAWVQHCAYMACYVPPEAHPEPGHHVLQPPRPHLRPRGLFAGARKSKSAFAWSQATT